MRTSFIDELILQARHNPRIFLVVGDLGFSVVEPFAAEFSDRFLNAGVAEQNMTGLAAGLASEGFHVFTYSIANFPTLRCLEQIRNDVCYHQLPVTVVSVGAGTAYGNLGYSHHCVQDIACLRGMPGLMLLSPADPGEARACVRMLASNPGPSYLRLGKAGEKQIHEQPVTLEFPVSVHSRGASIAICATGSVLVEAVAASEILMDVGVTCDVLSLVCLNASPASLSAVLGRYRYVLTVEEHVGPGGIGEMVATAIGSSIRVERAFVPDAILSMVGSQDYLRRAAGLDARALAERVRLAAGTVA